MISDNNGDAGFKANPYHYLLIRRPAFSRGLLMKKFTISFWEGPDENTIAAYFLPIGYFYAFYDLQDLLIKIYFWNDVKTIEETLS